MMLGVAIAGLAVLIAIAATIGYLDARARDGAWKRIASARHQLWATEQGLIACLERDMCEGCPVGRYLRDQHSG